MFTSLGRIVTRAWPWLLAGWVAVLAGTWVAAPAWKSVAAEGEFNFLPPNAPSRRADELFQRAFPGRASDSTLVVVLHRDTGKTGIQKADRDFIDKQLKPGIERIAEASKRWPVHSSRPGQGESAKGDVRSDGKPVIYRIRTPEDAGVGALLVSEDHRAALVVVEISQNFFERRSQRAATEVENLVRQLRREGTVPAGLGIDLTGSALVGRDYQQARRDSARRIEAWTVWVVVLLLLAVYRAPLVALIPLATLFFAAKIALNLLAMLGKAGVVGLFSGLEVYTTVLVYGAGVDYSLFLIGRYREELRARSDPRDAVAAAVGSVGHAITASGATVILGIGMLALARFGKFHDAGISVAFALLVMMAVILTFAPTLLCLAGRWAFWPHTANPQPGSRGWFSFARFAEKVWERVGFAVERRPALIWLAVVALLSPLAAWAVWNHSRLDYGLLTELAPNTPSAAGTRALERHYPRGATAPLSLVVRDDRVDFTSDEGRKLIKELTDRLASRRDELALADIRSLSAPLGMSKAAHEAVSGGLATLFGGAVKQKAAEHYVSHARGYQGHVTRLDLLPKDDPFDVVAFDRLGQIERAVAGIVPGRLRNEAQYGFFGVTSSLRDVRTVAIGDRTRIYSFVTLAVFVVLVVLLRRLILSAYLMATVVFGFLVSLGATFLFFQVVEGRAFSGLDRTVPIFLFAVLVAVGADYNIFLVTRVEEEQRRHGPLDGVRVALTRTGGIISSCGLIMAGTFSSLAFGGTLASMYQLGFALAFGVLLDTFLVRPVLVPAYLVLVNRRRASAGGGETAGHEGAEADARQAHELHSGRA